MYYLVKNRPIQAKCVSSVTNYSLGLETAMAPVFDQEMALTVNTGNLSANDSILHGD